MQRQPGMYVCPHCSGPITSTLRPGRCPDCQGKLERASGMESANLCGALINKRFRLEALIGEGAYGWVYRGRHLELDRPVAMKIMKPAGDLDDSRTLRFQTEARLLSQLNHPNILSVIDLGQTPGGVRYIATELVEGITLGSLLDAREPLPLDRIVRIVGQILAALAEAHAVGIVHRDLKPENIMLSPRRTGGEIVKVLDFGIAKGLGRSNLTGQGQLIGTPAYMSPEQARGQPATPQSDLYSVGAILYELLTGRSLFEGDSVIEILGKQLHESPLPLHRTAGGRRHPQRLEKVLNLALAKNPADRFSDAVAFRRALNEAVRESRVGPHAPPSNAPLPPKLIGRNAELEQLETFLRGSAQSLGLVGAQGLGCTAMLDALEWRASGAGWLVLRAAANPVVAPSPWYPIRRLVQQVLGLAEAQPERAELQQAMKREGLDAAQREALSVLFGLTPAPTHPDDALSNLDLRDAAVGALRRAAGADRRGVLLLLDDVDTYDQESLALVERIEAEAAELGVKLVLTATATTELPNGAVEGVIQLSPLPGPVIESLARRHAPALALSEEKWRELVRQAAGNPLRLLRRLREPDLGALRPMVPAVILSKQQRRLSHPAQELLETLTVRGTRVPRAQVEAALGEDCDATEAIRELVAAGFLADGPEQELALRYPADAPLIRASLAPARAVELHRRWTEVLRDQRRTIIDQAWHSSEGLTEGDAVALLRRAAEKATGWRDHHGASALLGRAIRVARWELLLDDEDELSQELSIELAECLFRAGQLRGAEVTLKAVLGVGRLDPALGARLCLTLSRVEQALARPQQALDSARQAVAQAADAGSAPLLVAATRQLSGLLLARGEDETAAEVIQASLGRLNGKAKPEGAKSLPGCWALHTDLAVALHRRGDLAGAVAAARRALYQAEREGTQAGQQRCRELLTELFAAQGRQWDGTSLA